jgi:hypothetical protein
MELLEIESRVAAGAAWLDERVPGWTDRVALSYLNINSPFSCVLGQVYETEGRAAGVNGFYYVQRELMRNDNEMAIALGFNASKGEYEDRAAEMPVLTEAWCRLILAKRAELALAA